MGQIRHGKSQPWDVYLEVGPHGDHLAMRGRVHFVAGERHRESAWIFLEYSEKDIRERFNDFSDVEIWNLLESLGP